MIRTTVAAALIVMGMSIGAKTTTIEPTRSVSVDRLSRVQGENAPDPLQSSSCGDGRCSPPEDCNTCPQDCGNCCGDHRCAPPEDCHSCPEDCGRCASDHR